MVKLKDKCELFELIKGPHSMKHLCEEYNKHKGRNVFKDFNDNGDCEPNEIDWIYNGSIHHCYDGVYYCVSCCVRDPYDRNENIYPEVRFWIEFNSDVNESSLNNLPELENFVKDYQILTVSQFFQVMNTWEKFAKEGIKKIKKHRRNCLIQLSPDPDTKYFYDYTKNYLLSDIKNQTNNILNLVDTDIDW